MITVKASTDPYVLQRFGYFRGAYDNDKIGDIPKWSWLAKIGLGKVFTTALYRFTSDHHNPLTLYSPTGIGIRPRDTFDNDEGSVPLVLQPIIPKDLYLLSFLFHDSAYEDHGLFMRRVFYQDDLSGYDDFWDAMPIVINEDWEFVEMTQEQADKLLYLMTGAEGAMAAHRNMIYSAVAVAGGPSWRDR